MPCRLFRISTWEQIWPGCCDPSERAEKKNKEGRSRRVDERFSLCGILWLTFKGSLRFRFHATGNPMGNRLVYSWVLWCGLTGWRVLFFTVSYGKIFLFLRAGCKKNWRTRREDVSSRAGVQFKYVTIERTVNFDLTVGAYYSIYYINLSNWWVKNKLEM